MPARGVIKVVLQIVAIALIIGGGVAIFLYLKATKPEPVRQERTTAGPLVETIVAQARPTTMTVVGFGTARAKRDLMLTTQVAGEIVSLAPSLLDGAFFRKGETLIEIDPRQYEFAVAQLTALIGQGDSDLKRIAQEHVNASASLALADEEVVLAERENERAKSLYETDSDSLASYDRARQSLVAARARRQVFANQIDLLPSQEAAAKARLAQTRAQLDEAKLRLGYTTVVAPFDGRVLKRMVEAGQYVAPGAALARVYDATVLEIPLRVPLDDLQWIETASLLGSLTGVEGETVDIFPRAELRLNVGQNQFVWRGVVARAEGEIDQSTRMAGLIVEVRQPLARAESGAVAPLVPGLFVEIEIEGRHLPNVIMVPSGAVDEGGVVRLVEDNRLVSRRVTVLRAMNGDTMVEGLTPGEAIVVTPLTAPVEGMSLRIASPDTTRSTTEQDGAR